MKDIVYLCAKPFIDLLKVISDFPVAFCAFLGIIGGLIMQGLGFAILTFFIALAFMGLIYIVTGGRAFGRGGHNRDFTIRS